MAHFIVSYVAVSDDDDRNHSVILWQVVVVVVVVVRTTVDGRIIATQVVGPPASGAINYHSADLLWEFV